MSARHSKSRRQQRRAGANNAGDSVRGESPETAIEIAAEDVERFDAALQALALEDIAALAARLDVDKTREINKLLDIRVDPRFVRGGIERLLKATLGSATGSRKVEAIRLLSFPVLDAAITALGDSRENPTEQEMRELVVPLIEEFGEAPTALLYSLVVLEQMPAARLARKCLIEIDSLAAVVALPLAEEVDAAISAPEGSKASATKRERAASPHRPNGLQVTDQDLPGAPQSQANLETALFSELDRVLINAIVSAFAGEVGAVGIDELEVAIQHLLDLNSRNKSSYFHLGFFHALSDRRDLPKLPEMEQERWDWYWFGYLSGLVRRDAERELRRVCKNHRESVLRTLSTPRTGRSLFARTALANLDANPQFVVDALADRASHAGGMSVFDSEELTLEKILERVRVALIENETGLATELSQAIIKWCDQPGVAGLTPLQVRAHRYCAASSRSSGDFDAARAQLDQAHELLRATESEQGKLEALLTLEFGLVEAQLDHLVNVRIPSDEDVANDLRAKLEDGEELFRMALELDPAQAQAAYCMGILEFLRRDWAEGAKHLANAAEKMRNDELYSASAADLYSEAAFLSGVARICGEKSARADKDAQRLVELIEGGGYQPVDWVVKMVAEVVFLKSPDAAASFSLAALKVVKDPGCLVEVISEVLSSPNHENREQLAQTALDLSGDDNLIFTDKISLAIGGLRCAASLPEADALVEKLVDRCEDLADGSGSDDVAELWLDSLKDPDGWANKLLGPVQRQVASAMVLVRLRRRALAIDQLVRLAHQLASGADNLGGISDIAECLREMGAEAETIAQCERLTGGDGSRAPDGLDEATLVDPIGVVFVGGNETQRRYRGDIEKVLRDRFGSKLGIDWHYPGWSSNWAPTAERALDNMRSADCLVLMPLVRTNLGRRLRRGVGEMGKPWVPCTGRGRDSIQRAIERAVDVVHGQRRGS